MLQNANKPRITLVRPRDLGSVPTSAPVQDPLGVGYLASSLRSEGYEVYVLDAHSLGLDTATLAACSIALHPEIVGLSLHSFADYKHCVEFSRILKANSSAICVWGGEHATYNATRILQQHLEVDAVVLGEGEGTVLEIAHAVEQQDFGTCSIAGAVVRLLDGSIVNGGFQNFDCRPRRNPAAVQGHHRGSPTTRRTCISITPHWSRVHAQLHILYSPRLYAPWRRHGLASTVAPEGSGRTRRAETTIPSPSISASCNTISGRNFSWNLHCCKTLGRGFHFGNAFPVFKYSLLLHGKSRRYRCERSVTERPGQGRLVVRGRWNRVGRRPHPAALQQTQHCVRQCVGRRPHAQERRHIRCEWIHHV